MMVKGLWYLAGAADAALLSLRENFPEVVGLTVLICVSLLFTTGKLS